MNKNDLGYIRYLLSNEGIADYISGKLETKQGMKLYEYQHKWGVTKKQMMAIVYQARHNATKKHNVKPKKHKLKKALKTKQDAFTRNEKAKKTVKNGWATGTIHFGHYATMK